MRGNHSGDDEVNFLRIHGCCAKGTCNHVEEEIEILKFQMKTIAVKILLIAVN
jgi:hypothetical protein